MDEGGSTEIGELPQSVAASNQLRTADRKQLLGAKTGGVRARSISIAVANGEIDILAREVNVVGLSADPEIDFGMDLGEAAEPLNKPLRRKVR